MQSIAPAIRELYQLLVSEPARLLQVDCHLRSDVLEVPDHVHDDIIQFDLLMQCEGTVGMGDQKIRVTGTTALTFYPNTRHSFRVTLSPNGVARIYSIKLRVPSQTLLMTDRPFLPLNTDFHKSSPLFETMRVLERLWLAPHHNTLRVVAIIGEMLSLWPTRMAPTAPVPNLSIRCDQDGLIEESIAMIERSLLAPKSLDEIADSVGLSPRHFSRRFKAAAGMTFSAYWNQRRLTLARTNLAQGRRSVTETASLLGFPSIHAFSRWFKRLTGQSPSCYRAETPPL